MNRRQFLAAAVAASTALVAGAESSPTYRPFGRVRAASPLGTRVKCVTVNGMDVTGFAYDGDDREGWVSVYEWEGFPSPPNNGVARTAESGMFHVEGRTKLKIQKVGSGRRVVRGKILGAVRFTLKDEA